MGRRVRKAEAMRPDMPHKMAGEGHFMAMFRKTEREEDKKPGSGQMEKSRGKGLKKVKGKKRENGAADPEQKSCWEIFCGICRKTYRKRTGSA